MKTYVEMWKAKPSWQELPNEERAEYLSQIAPHLQNPLTKGMKIISYGQNDRRTSQRADFDFFSVLQFPDQQAVDAYEKEVGSMGWNNYFEHKCMRGTSTSLEEVISKMIKL